MSMSLAETGRRPAITHAAVLRLAVPMVLAHLSTPLLGFVDATVIGRLGQPVLLGAVAAAAVIFDFAFWGAGFLRMGTASLTAQALGRGDAEEGQAVVMRAMILALAIGFALIILQVPIGFLGFSLLKASDAVTEAARTYYDIRIWSAPFALANYVLLGTFIGRGKTGVALGLQVLINLSNIIFNIILVYGLAWGVKGSAMGTLMAEILGVFGGFFVLARGGAHWRRVDMALVKNRERLAEMMVVNRDLTIRTAALLLSYAFFTSQGAREGDIVLAANALLMNLYLICAYFLDGFATAAQQLCGEAYGAGNGPRFRAAVRITLLWCLGFSALLGAIAMLVAPAFLNFITTSDAVRVEALHFVPFAATAAFWGALAFAFDGIFIGATWTKDMRNMMLVSLTIYIVSYFLLRGFGNAGLWSAFLIFLVLRGITLAWRYRILVRDAFPEAQSAAVEPTQAASG